MNCIVEGGTAPEMSCLWASIQNGESTSLGLATNFCNSLSASANLASLLPINNNIKIIIINDHNYWINIIIPLIIL